MRGTKTDALDYIKQIAEYGIPKQPTPFFTIGYTGVEFTTDSDSDFTCFPKYYSLNRIMRETIKDGECSAEELLKCKKHVLGWLRLIDKRIKEKT